MLIAPWVAVFFLLRPSNSKPLIHGQVVDDRGPIAGGRVGFKGDKAERVETALRRAGALAAAMSGSGSTVFGLFQQRSEAEIAVEKLSGSGWRVLMTESLGRGEYARRSRPRALRSRPRGLRSRPRALRIRA